MDYDDYLCMDQNKYYTFNTVSKCLSDLIEEYYMKEQQLDYFLVIKEAFR